MILLVLMVVHIKLSSSDMVIDSAPAVRCKGDAKRDGTRLSYADFKKHNAKIKSSQQIKKESLNGNESSTEVLDGQQAQENQYKK